MDPATMFSVGGSLLGGLIGRKKSAPILSTSEYRVQRARQVAEIKGMRDLAEDAGFHPLELLRSGAGGGGSQPTLPRVASNTALANAFGEIGQTLAEAYRAKNEGQLAQEKASIARDEAARGVKKSPVAVGPAGYHQPQSLEEPSEERPATFTRQQADPRDPMGTDTLWSFPHRQDATFWTERLGDGEATQELLSYFNTLDDITFTRDLRAIAKQEGMSVTDAYNKTYDDPAWYASKRFESRNEGKTHWEQYLDPQGPWQTQRKPLLTPSYSNGDMMVAP